MPTDSADPTPSDVISPPWATGYGADRFGVYAEFSCLGLIQRMRWIAPGRFRMGSPEDEPGRHYDETAHDVELTRGFWLSDTACPQALWQAAMGDNPSQFVHPLHPVENVSWDDCQAFMRRINGERPELALRLPTEAEWEYACRAGTLTPFNLGSTLTPQQVNYDGNAPYVGAKKGEYRERTVEVGSLPCNPWGLFETHGNVWEWCQDWYGEYEAGAARDPSGPAHGRHRVLRGGGWLSVARLVRSACRDRYAPNDRFGDMGFRFARTHDLVTNPPAARQ